MNKSRHPTRFFNKIHVFTRTRTTLYIHENFRFSETSCFFVVCFQAHFDDDGAAAYTKRIGDRLGGGVGLGGWENFFFTAEKKQNFSWSQIITLSLVVEAVLYKRLQHFARRGVSFQIKMEHFIKSQLDCRQTNEDQLTRWSVKLDTSVVALRTSWQADMLPRKAMKSGCKKTR